MVSLQKRFVASSHWFVLFCRHRFNPTILQIRMVHETGFVRYPALKTLAFAVSNNVKNAEHFVAAGGLKIAFPAFLGKGRYCTLPSFEAGRALPVLHPHVPRNGLALQGLHTQRSCMT
jgi:hypothetical protein